MSLLMKIILAFFIFSFVLLVISIFSIIKEKEWFKRKRTKQKEKFRESVQRGKYSAGKAIGKIQRHFATMNPKERNKSKLYKYYYHMRTALSASGLDEYVGVEVMFIVILISSIVASALLTTGLGWFIFTAVFIVALVSLHTAVLFVSRADVFDRVIMLMKTEDMLSSSMDLGVVKAIEDNLEYIDSKVRKPFDDFITNHLSLRISVQDSLAILNTEIGPSYDTFCEMAYQHYTDNDEELINGFKGIIESNNRKRNRLLVRRNIFEKSMFYYLVLLVTTVVFLFFMAGMLSDIKTYLLSYSGRVSTILSVSTAAVGFIISQMIYTGGIDL